MYVDNLSGSTVYMLNGFMKQREEKYLLISDKFGIEGYGKKYYVSFVLEKTSNAYDSLNGKAVPSRVIMSDLKKASGKMINIESSERNLEVGWLCLANISLPVYALLKKCLNILLNDKEVKYEKLIRFEKPIDINAQCDNNGYCTSFQYYGATLEFPLVGFVVFDNEYITARYDYNKIEI